MEVQAIARNIRISPRKLRLMADSIRGLSYARAIALLDVTGKRAAGPLSTALHSAASNATSKGMDKDGLLVKTVEIMEGIKLKRYHPSSRGRIHPYKKRGSHIRVILSDDKSQISNLKFQIKKENKTANIKSQKDKEGATRE